MSRAAIKGTAYCLNYAHYLGSYYGNTPYMERHEHADSEFLKKLPDCVQSWEGAASYAPNLTYIGAMTTDELASHPQPWHANLSPTPKRFGKYGEIMPEDEFIGLMDICDVFDLIWLEKGFAEAVAKKLESHPLLGEAQLKRLEKGHELPEIEKEVRDAAALPLYLGKEVIGCCRKGHDLDENLAPYILLENIASKAGGVLTLLHLLKNSGMSADEVDFVIECSEEAAGDMNQRGGGNIAKAIAEIAGCANASGCDIRAFCAAPVNAMIAGAAMVASGARANVAVLAGGAVPKLYMNAKDHVKKDLQALENCMGCFGALLTPDDGVTPIMRLDCLGKHTVAAGASPQAVTTALVWNPLEKAGLSFADVDKYAPELHIPEITLPAGAGNVPEGNYKMIAALAVMKGQLQKSEIPSFVAKHGLPGFAHTQGHIPSGVPYLGHAVDAIAASSMKRAMIIGKGSLFLARLTNLSDGASFLVEAASPLAPAIGKGAIKEMLLEALEEIASSLKNSGR